MMTMCLVTEDYLADARLIGDFPHSGCVVVQKIFPYVVYV